MTLFSFLSHDKDAPALPEDFWTTHFPTDPMPVNPLWKKWLEKYPPTPKPEASQVCDGYSCIWCGRCPHGDNWKCPEEDRETYDQYLRDLDAWKTRHPDFLGEIYIQLPEPKTK